MEQVLAENDRLKGRNKALQSESDAKSQILARLKVALTFSLVTALLAFSPSLGHFSRCPL